MNSRTRQSGKVVAIVLFVLVILVISFWKDMFPVDLGPEILSVESFDCEFAYDNSVGDTGPTAGVAGRFDIGVMNLSDENLTNIFIEVSSRHPDSRGNTHSLVTQLSPARFLPGRLGHFKGAIAAPQMAMANASVDKLVCLMKISKMVDGELQPIAVRLNGLELVSASEPQVEADF